MSTSSEKSASADREIVTTRVLDAPRELVWKAWTDPNQVGNWWGPDGFTTTIIEMSVRSGGVWRFVMHGPNGIDYPNRVIFDEVVAPERLTYAHDDGEGGGGFHTTVTFENQGGKTLLTLRAVFKSAEELAYVVREHGAVEGAAQTIARLDAYLRTIAG